MDQTSPDPGLLLIIRCCVNGDVFCHVTAFLQLEEIAVLMPTCQLLRQKCLQLPEWLKAQAQLSALNCFDRCAYCHKPLPLPRFCDCGNGDPYDDPYDDCEWLKANDPRLCGDYVHKTAYAQFGLLYAFHAACTKNLLDFFDLGGNANSLRKTVARPPSDDMEEGPWKAVAELFFSSRRHFHLLLDIVSLFFACCDLKCSDGPYWYRSIFQGSWKNPDTGSSFTGAFEEAIEDLYDMAIENKVEFGSNEHFRVWASSLKCHTEWDSIHAKSKPLWDGGGLGKLGSRHLRVVSPMWRVKVTIDEILDRIDPEETITKSEEDAEVEEEP